MLFSFLDFRAPRTTAGRAKTLAETTGGEHGDATGAVATERVERGEEVEDMKDQGAGGNMLSPSLQPTASRIWRKHLATADRVQREDGTSGANASTSSLASGSEENEVSSVLRLRPKRSLDLTRTDGCECHSPLQPPKPNHKRLPLSPSLSLSLYHTNDHLRHSHLCVLLLPTGNGEIADALALFR